MRKYAVFFALLALAGCASKPDNIGAASVSTLEYKDYSCKQIGMEINRVSKRANELYTELDKKANRDAGQMAAGVILWPTLFFLEGGDGVQAQEYSRLKGEFDALEKVAVQKNCNIDIPERVIVKEAKKQ